MYNISSCQYLIHGIFYRVMCLKLKRSKYTLKFNGTSENGFDCLLKSVQMMIFLQQQYENR